jgi:hypothetical protein
MRDVLNIIALAVISLPLLLILNDSGTFVPNLIGLAYACILLLIGKRKSVKRYFDGILESCNNLIDNILK